MPTDADASRREPHPSIAGQHGARDDAKIGDVDGSFPGNGSHSNKIITLAEEPPHVR